MPPPAVGAAKGEGGTYCFSVFTGGASNEDVGDGATLVFLFLLAFLVGAGAAGAGDGAG